MQLPGGFPGGLRKVRFECSFHCIEKKENMVKDSANHYIFECSASDLWCRNFQERKDWELDVQACLEV